MLSTVFPGPSQAYAVAAVRSVLQAQLDDLNAIFEVQLAEGKKEAALAAARDARAENADVERRVAAAVADAVSRAQQEADRQRVEAVRAALALAAGEARRCQCQCQCGVESKSCCQWLCLQRAPG